MSILISENVQGVKFKKLKCKNNGYLYSKIAQKNNEHKKKKRILPKHSYFLVSWH